MSTYGAARRSSLRHIARRSLRGVLIGLVLLFILAPIYWLVISSISSPIDLVTVPPHWLPWPPDLSYYRELIFGSGQAGTTLTGITLRTFRYALRNSVLVATGVTLLCLALGSLAGYAFSKLRVPFGEYVIYLLLLMQMLPVVVLLVPLQVTLSRLDMLDKLSTVLLLLAAVHLPFVIWILRSYFQGIPPELEEAAFVDGATRLQAIYMIVLPLSLPGLFAAGVYTFMQSWNAFMIPLIFTSSDVNRTVTVAIAMFAGQHYTDYGLMSAAGVLAILPPAILAVFFQRYLLAGLTAGAVKG